MTLNQFMNFNSKHFNYRLDEIAVTDKNGISICFWDNRTEKLYDCEIIKLQISGNTAFVAIDCDITAVILATDNSGKTTIVSDVATLANLLESNRDFYETYLDFGDKRDFATVCKQAAKNAIDDLSEDNEAEIIGFGLLELL